MNRYAWWKYALLTVALVLATVYALPNLFGEAPAVQVSAARAAQRLGEDTVARLQQALQQAQIAPEAVQFDGATIKVRLASTEQQIRARDVIERTLNPDAANPGYVVALNLLPRTPAWLQALGARPMYLGLDLRGGVHFLLQVDMAAAARKRLDAVVAELRTLLRERDLRHGGVRREGEEVLLRLRDADTARRAADLIAREQPDLQLTERREGEDWVLALTLRPQAVRHLQEQALKQNILTLHNRINELGVAEPVIQQQGLDRIVVQLPGVQDTAKAKDILGRTATLEIRMVDESPEGLAAERDPTAPVPFGSERYLDRHGRPVIVKREVILTGDNLTDAQAGFDSQTHEPVVNLTLDGKGARIFRDVTRDNVGKRMAILLFEKGQGEVVTAPVIRTEIGGGRVQISGRMTTQEANDIALLLRAGALAAPMEIVEERTIGPSLGADNIRMGFNSVVWGFVAVVAFMCVYYTFFGLVSSLALAFNLLLLVAILSLLQATLTLPGIAAIALTLGMAIDANVLINERIREELRNGSAPQTAIHKGYEHAWGTIVDSNLTSLLAGLALLTFGSGPVRGFAVVHCIGILTSMFSAVMFSRGLVNLWYGRQRKLKSIAIGIAMPASTGQGS
ncbi:MAG: protein translocase subunit SecD [Tepidimonas sp.]|nr:protein translocase subunit SecD [Tepidimonas sp.]